MRACLITSILLGAAGMGQAEAPDGGETQWIPASDPRFEIRGLPFFAENEGHWWRLPARAKDVVPGLVWEVSKSPAGARIRFSSDTTSVAIRYACDKKQPALNNFSLFGEAGLDLYIDGQYAASAIPPALPEEGRLLVAGLSKQMREFCLYLPLYTEVAVESIGLDAGAAVHPAPAFANARPVVFYGTSITQGGCAGRAGLSYEAMLCRRLNLDFVNFGFSGSGKGESEVAKLIAEVDASGFVLDFSQNTATPEDLEKVYLPFIETLRARHADTPIICVTPIYWAAESTDPLWRERQDRMRAIIRDAVRKRIDNGDPAIHLVEGCSLLGPERGDGLVDGLHPDTLGFHWMAKGLAPHIQKALGLTR